MTRRGFFLLLAGAPVAGSTEQDLRPGALAFEKHWDPFLRSLFGCEMTGPTTEETCRLVRTRVDYKQFRAAREEAKKFFELRE